MKVEIIHNSNVFSELNVPKYGMYWISNKEDIKIPNLQFNKTYYKLCQSHQKGNEYTKIEAFRILAMAVTHTYANGYEISYFIQLPNEQPKWEKEYIGTGAYRSNVVFANKNDIYEYLNGNFNLNIVGDKSQFIKVNHSLMSNLYMCGINVEEQWSVSSCGIAERTLSDVKEILIVDNVIYVVIDDSPRKFKTKEDAVNYFLNGMNIEDFEDDDTMELQVIKKPQTRKVVKTIHIVEEISY
jgi:hypothetical protein